jgi:cold shock CspA family protein/ribosome-associated translation inhibitor RaiA
MPPTEVPVEVTGKGYTLTPAEEDAVRAAVSRLERFYGRLTACKVVVAVPNRRPTGDPVAYTVRLALSVPQGELAVTRQAKPSFREALQDAFDAARRQLQDFGRELRGDIKQHGPADRGIVSRLLSYEGYGFITTEDGRELYFHRNSVLDEGFDRLAEGMEVRFAEEEGEKGPQASSVVPAA